MELSEKDIHLIEGAILDKLSDEDQILLEEKLRDVQFSEEYERHRQMVNLVSLEGRSDFKAGLQKVDSELPPFKTKKPRIVPMYLRWLVAASVIGIVGYLGFFRSDSISTLTVYNKYYEAYPNLIDPVTKGNESGAMSPFQLYESEKYEASQLAFSDLEDSEERDFYYALTFLKTDDFETAILKLSAISKDDTHRFTIDANWYLALAHLGAQNLEKAKSILKEISVDKDNPFRDRAVKVLVDLE